MAAKSVYFLFVCPQISIKMASVMKFSCVLIVFALLVSMSAAKPYTGSLERAEKRSGDYCNQDSDCDINNTYWNWDYYRGKWERIPYTPWCIVDPPPSIVIPGYKGYCTWIK